jgi:hypothetical protein
MKRSSSKRALAAVVAMRSPVGNIRSSNGRYFGFYGRSNLLRPTNIFTEKETEQYDFTK